MEKTAPQGIGEVPRVDKEIEDAIRRIAREEHQGHVNIGRMNEWGPWVRWAIGLAAMALFAAVGSYMQLSAKISGFQQGQQDMRAEVAQIYQWLAPRYRAQNNGP